MSQGIFILGIHDKMMLFLGLSFNVISFISLAPKIDITPQLRFKDVLLLNWQYVFFLQDAHEFFHVLSSTLDDEMVIMLFVDYYIHKIFSLTC